MNPRPERNRLLDLFPMGPILADGAWGTELQKLGLAPGEPSDPWNLTHPGEVRTVARSYAEAGSQLLLTNTFQSSLPALRRRGLAGQWREINVGGVALSRAEIGPGRRLFGSIGPCGLPAEDRSAARTAYRDQAGLLADCGVDGLVLETFTDPCDARVAAEACCSTALPLVLSFVLGFGPGGDRTPTGASIAELVRVVEETGADAVGLNCGASLGSMVRLLPVLRSSTRLPLWFKPTAGYPVPIEPAEFTATILGAFPPPAVLGGCCGAGPGHIASLASCVRSATA